MTFSFPIDVATWLKIGLPALVGIALLVVAALVHLRSRAVFKKGITTTGVIVRFAARDSGADDGTVRAPIVKFKTRTGEDIEFESSLGSSPMPYGKGEEVPVVYSPEYPQQAEISQPMALWGMELVLGGFGILSLGFALLVLIATTNMANQLGPVATFGFFGIALLVVAIVIYRIAGSSRNEIKTVGVVVQTLELQLGPILGRLPVGGPALIRFSAPSGAEIEFVAEPPSRDNRKGAQVAVFYDPTRPGSAHLTRRWQPRRMAIMLGILGVGLILMPVYFLLRSGL